MIKVLVTGGIGSGKSLVAYFLREQGAFVYDSDAEAKRLYMEDLSLMEKISSMFGTSVYGPEGINTRAIADVVFADAGALRSLEKIVHPAVKEDFLQRAAASGKDVAVMESAIAASKPVFRGFFDFIIAVTAPEPLRLRRAATRDHADEASVRRRMDAQTFVYPDKVDFVIVNDSDLNTLKEQAVKAWNSIQLPLKATKQKNKEITAYGTD